MIRRLRKGAVPYGIEMAIFLGPTRRKMLFEIRTKASKGKKAI